MSRWIPLAAVATFGCHDLDRFDTSGDDAYCGSIVDAQFVRTIPREGGFDRQLRMRVELDTSRLNTTPARITTDDGLDGECAPEPTFDDAPLRVTPETSHDAISTLNFGDAQEYNILGWTRSGCRGSVFTIVSLLRNDNIEVRLLKAAGDTATGEERDAFALFTLDRRQNCDWSE
jgi:hypothetical protein